MSLLKEATSKKHELSPPRPKNRPKKRDGSKSRSTVKMPPINHASSSLLHSLVKDSPYKISPRKLRPLNTSEVPGKPKPLSFFRQNGEDSAFDIKTTRSINVSKLKRLEITHDTVRTSSDLKDIADEEELTGKECLSPTKKVLLDLTSVTSKAEKLEVNTGFSQVLMNYGSENKEPSLELLSARKLNSLTPSSEKKFKNRTPSLGRHYLPKRTDSTIPEGIVNKVSPEEEFALPYIAPTKHSLKGSGVVTAYAANTNQGLVRNYNEDRVSIVLSISRPLESAYEGVWPACSFFGVYDGHGGEACADFLRDNLHQLIVRNSNFPSNPVLALQHAFAEAEAKFLELAEKPGQPVERSGSCALVVLIVDDTCYVANVGDSRAIMSCERGKRVIDLSRDHKPSDSQEQARIVKNGGRVYQTQVSQSVKAGSGVFASSYNAIVFGPHRVWPGRLSVSRTFGDIEAKSSKYDGLPGVVIAEPEIRLFKITEESDFIILGCDGIYDKLSSQEVSDCVWNSTFTNLSNIHKQSAAGVEYIMKQSLMKKTTDNITVVMVGLAGFKNAVSLEDTVLHTEEESLQASLTKSRIVLTEPLDLSEVGGLEKSQSTQRLYLSIGRKKEAPMKGRPTPIEQPEGSVSQKTFLLSMNSKKSRINLSMCRHESPETTSKLIKLKRRLLVSKSKIEDL